MKILMLTPYLPYPLLSGGQIRTFNLLKELGKKHQITLFALIKDESEREYIEHLKPYCHQVKVFKRTKNPWTLRNILLAGLTPYPFLVTRNLPSGMKAAIKQELNHDYDLIHAETFYMMPNIPKTQVPVLLVEQTIEYVGYEYYAQTTKHWYLKPFLAIDIAKIKYWEHYFWRKADRLVTMSEEDKLAIQADLGMDTRVDVVANGVDIEKFKQVPKKLSDAPTILFVGTFKWLPNVDAVRYLVNEIWPGVVKKVPQAKLWIVGHSPTAEVKSYAQRQGVTVSASVKDIRQAYAKSHMLLAPIRSGKGTRYKILEAMATHTPVVTTSLGAEGLEIRNGQEVLIGDDTDTLVAATVKLLQQPKLQTRIADKAYKIVTRNYNWLAISRQLDKLYQQLGKVKND